MITARYEEHNDEWAITVAGLGKELGGKAPGIIAARDRADQLVDKITPEGTTPTVVHLLNGSALEFTTAYMTARLARPEQAPGEGEQGEETDDAADATDSTNTADTAEAGGSAEATDAEVTGEAGAGTATDEPAVATKPAGAQKAAGAQKDPAPQAAQAAQASSPANPNADGAHAAGQGKSAVPKVQNKPSGRRRKPEPAEDKTEPESTDSDSATDAPATPKRGVPRKDLHTSPQRASDGQAAEPASTSATPATGDAETEGTFVGAAARGSSSGTSHADSDGS